MKLLCALFICGTIFVQNAAHASVQIAILEFQKDPEVQFTIMNLVTSLKKYNGISTKIVQSAPSASELGGGCGFAGCESNYLVTMAFTPQVVNSQTEVVAAYVTLMNGHLLTLKVIPASQFKSILDGIRK